MQLLLKFQNQLQKFKKVRIILNKLLLDNLMKNNKNSMTTLNLKNSRKNLRRKKPCLKNKDLKDKKIGRAHV